ncbi:hypothetical protein M758_6G132200 [Ceratodon purpureus]|nr:hypothetical protein M758_6G132200 [Ceratodon purpureus]
MHLMALPFLPFHFPLIACCQSCNCTRVTKLRLALVATRPPSQPFITRACLR